MAKKGKPVEKKTPNNPHILVCTTFANRHWDEHAQLMVQSFDKYWPDEVKLVTVLDDNVLAEKILPVVQKRGGAIGTLDDDEVYQAFKTKWHDKDHPTDYRKQFFRFCHKYFALKDAVDLSLKMNVDYLIWLDADVETTQPISWEDLKAWLPGDGEVCSYLGRKDWDHSECGFMAFNLNGVLEVDGGMFIEELFREFYLKEGALTEQQQHDSWLFDVKRARWDGLFNRTESLFKNLTAAAAGMNVWLNSPLQSFMIHHKGPVAKAKLVDNSVGNGDNSSEPGLSISKPLNVQVKNCVDHEVIRKNVSANLGLIDRWIRVCDKSDETVVMVSGGPTLDVARVKHYARLGYRIVCVKHALERLLAAGITPWACILLDPRVHVENFVSNPDKRINWLVSSMVDPKVTQRLLENGCKIWGYHAAVGAGEEQYVGKGQAFVAFGSASATRGLFVLEALGFSKFILLGYDLCHMVKPDLNESGADGNKKYLEITLSHQTWGGGQISRTFWTEGQLLAQAQEMEQIFSNKMLEVRAEGDGMVPWLLHHKREYKRWWKQVYKPRTLSTSADKMIGHAGWRNRLLRVFQTKTWWS